MQQLDAITLKALARELALMLDGAKVSKVQHPSAHEFLITFWGGADRRDEQTGEAYNIFYIHLNPEAPFCALISNRQKQSTVLNTFSKPTSLCMLLRKHLNGANLVDVRTLPGERVLDLVFENFNELGNKVRLVLSLELMGKHTNMIFYDDVQGNILGVAHGVSERMSSVRELAAGLPYALPPKPADKQVVSEMTQEAFMRLWDAKPPEQSNASYLNRYLAGWGLRLLEDVLAITDDPKSVYQLLNTLESGNKLLPSVSPSRKFFTLVLKSENDWQALTSVNALMQTYFLTQLQEVRLHRKQHQLLLSLSHQMTKLQRREKELVPIDDAELNLWQATGDRLLAAQSAREVIGNNPTSGMVQLTHYETGEPWSIEVDPSCSWVENAQIYYRRAKKAKTRKSTYEQMAEQLNNERLYLETLIQLAEQAELLADLDAIETDLQEAGYTSKKTDKENSKKKAAATTGILSFRASDGQDILVGKSGQGNEAIVGKLSRSDDIWLHVHQMPGSHVLVRCEKGEISNQTLLEAASLAVWYSSARDSLNVPVIYTQCKFVRKIPHSYPGHVNYREEQTVFISPDAKLIEKLLHTRTAPQEDSAFIA